MRATAFLLAVVAVGSFGRAGASPADIFSSPAPVIGADPPKAADIHTGDASVATQTGALQYSYPIQVPPGRGGMAPHLALAYSSQAPVYGTIAAGWSLAIPIIEEDTSQGRLRTHSPEVEAQQGFEAAGADDRFVSSLAGGRPLVAVTEPMVTLSARGSAGVYRTYRAQNDASFSRYERMGTSSTFRWRVYTTDGTVLYFGDNAQVAGCTNIDEGNAPLTRTVDSFGNEVRYTYGAGVNDECRISHIEYGQNANAAVDSFASVTFTYATPNVTCSTVPVGSQVSYRTGRKKVTGSAKLTTIFALAYAPGAPSTPVHTRQITLAYSAADESCTAQHAPLRLLTSIQESAWGTDAPRVDLPAVTFEYGDTTVSLNAATNAQDPPWLGIDPIGNHPQRKYNLGWGYRSIDEHWPTVEAMMIDIDGDGLPDRLVNASTSSTCQASWQRNMGMQPATGTLQFAAPQPIALPRLKWSRPTVNPPADPTAGGSVAGPDDGCALNGQVTSFGNSVGASCNALNGPTTCQASGDPDNPGPYCYPNATDCPSAGQWNGFTTYLAYRWMDMDGDGLPDLVAAVHGDKRLYDIDQGGAPAFVGHPEPLPFGAWPACPAIEKCKALSASCVNPYRSCPVGGLCTIDWTAVNTCLAGTHSEGCFNQLKDGVGFLLGPPPGGGGSGAVFRTPYSRCEGLYPWAIYKNQGNGAFASTPVIKYQPIPLESDVGDSSITSPLVAANNHGVLDFDGDGIPDAIAHPKFADPQQPFSWWFVWLGDGTGGMGPKRYTFSTRESPNNRVSAFGTTDSQWARSSEGLFDLNGDGLLDHWTTPDVYNSNTTSNLAFHDGTQHEMFGVAGAPSAGLINTPSSPAIKTGNDTVSTVTDCGLSTCGSAHGPVTGDVTATNRTIDVDGDGRADVVSNVNGAARVFFNGGGAFLTAGPSYPGDLNGARRNVHARAEFPGDANSKLLWELRSDLIDLDGDGIAESVDIPSGLPMTRMTRSYSVPPPRLLNKIKNGRGAETSISYASLHNPTFVTQTPGELWFDGRPKATPHNQWVVAVMSTTDSFPSTATSTASYFYKNPRHGADDEGHYSFRGFETVTTTGQSGAQTVQVYSYTPDWSGRLVKTLVIPARTEWADSGLGVAEVRSMEATTWEYRQLFNGAITTFHATVSEHFVCPNGRNEGVCTMSPAGYTRSTTTLAPLASTTVLGQPAQMWQATESLLQTGTAAADGDRQTISTFAFASDTTTYRLRPLTATKNHRSGGAMVMFGKSAKTWDSSFRVPLTDEVWFDANDANRAIARSVYDMTTGNVTQHFKPKQNAAGSTSTSLTYDARKLFATTAINEAGHQLDFTFEYGTGMKLQSDGPNARACTSNCPSGATFPVKEEHKIRIDGLGRELEKWDTFSDDGNIYTLYQTQLTSYVDAATGSVPTSVFHQTRFDTAATFWKQEKTELDGHGRPFRKTVFAQGSAPNDEITSFFYSNDGTLKAVSVPDPTQNNASVVTYTYGFDSLGRPISIRRPDALSLTDQSGVNMAYDGVTKTVTEVVGTAGGNAASTTTIGDKLGRLVEVREKTGATTFAATHYTYGPDDLVTSVVDPDGVTTLLTHDFAGHRTQIERANGRKWKYGYDKNGNVVSEQVPGSPNPPFTDILYTTTIAYDDLDRVASKVIGQRNLSAADQALFASGTETYTWDYGPNHKGFLRYWQSFAPGSSTAAITVDAYNNNQGQRTLTKETLNIAGYPTLQQQFIRSYHLFGGVASTSYRDWVGGSNQTSSLTNYDKRLLPLEMVLQRSGMAAQTIGTQTRNVAGLVTKRRTNTTGPMTFVESNWTYDKLARVTSQVVQKGPGPTQVARQDLAYLGNDDPSSLDHYLGTTRRHFQYGFDFRHQITSAIETTTPGYFSGTYAYGSPTSSGRLTHVTESQTSVPFGSEVMPRDVNYQYAGTDPEEVTALVNASGSSQGQSFASYTFDASGNQITRCYGAATTPTCAGESLEFVYDGKGHLRRATSKQDGVVQGSEEYWYGASGDRISILKRDAAGTKLEMVWFVADSEAHFDATGVISHVYSHLSLGTPVARVDRTENAATLVEYQFHGLSTNAIAAVDQLGVINCSFTYSPFGTVVQGTDDGGDASGIQRHARRLNDKYQDVISSLHYYGARFYDAIGQQWTQADPLMLRVPDVAQTVPRRAHLYAFALQNPLRYQDPDGLDSVATQLVSQSMLCMKSSTGAGCVLDSGAAVYDGETEWLRSGGSLLAGVARGIDDSFSEASRGVIDAPSPVFAGGGVMVDPKTGAIIRTGDPKFFDDLSQVVEWIRDRGEEVAVRYVIRRLVGGVIAGVTEEDNSRDAPDASLTGKEREDYLNRKRAMSQGAGPKDVLSRGTRMGGGKNSQGGGAPDPEPEPPPPPLQGWQCNGPGSVCGGNPGPFKNPSAPFNTLCYWCFLKTAQRPPTGEDTR